jgi:hypothetical protein
VNAGAIPMVFADFVNVTFVKLSVLVVKEVKALETKFEEVRQQLFRSTDVFVILISLNPLPLQFVTPNNTVELF